MLYELIKIVTIQCHHWVYSADPLLKSYRDYAANDTTTSKVRANFFAVKIMKTLAN